VVDAAAVQRNDPPAPGKRPFKGPFSVEIGADEFIAGSPKTVADKIIDQCRRLGAGNIMAYHSSTMEEAQVAHNYALWEQVIPILAKADVLQTGAA
jgi:alkanesulfonate monooxygenase SsuD/methylene tetrahydromethanopterin reductase-like flavin-dependent oxidoreductase (luciferase family)